MATAITSQQAVPQTYTTEIKPYVADAGKTGGAGTEPAAAVAQGDSTSISSTSGLIAQALGGSDVRADKVSALQQSIAAGTYNVSSSDVASKIVDSLLS